MWSSTRLVERRGAPVDPIVLLAAGAVTVLGLSGAAIARRRSQQEPNWLAPARLGPSWSPSRPGAIAATELLEVRTARAEAVQGRTGLDRGTVDTVLSAWDEYRAVLGLADLPGDHAYRVYDPYVPPVAERGPYGPVPDPMRVARDVAARTSVSRDDAVRVLDALSDVAQDDEGTAVS